MGFNALMSDWLLWLALLGTPTVVLVVIYRMHEWPWNRD